MHIFLSPFHLLPLSTLFYKWMPASPLYPPINKDKEIVGSFTISIFMDDLLANYYRLGHTCWLMNHNIRAYITCRLSPNIVYCLQILLTIVSEYLISVNKWIHTSHYAIVMFMVINIMFNCSTPAV